MRKRRTETPTALADLLPRLAREQGAGRLRSAVLAGRVRRALGDWLGGRLLSCRRDGRTLELEIAGESAAREVEALRSELLDALRRELGGGAPAALRVRIGRSPAGTRSLPPAAAEPAPPPGPAVQEALESVADPKLRAQLARVAARGSCDRT